MKFFQFDQNNSGGWFQVDDKVCHRLFIEANSNDDAANRAENLGCYWDGVSNGMDCSCCGDRWYTPYNPVDIDEWNNTGYHVGIYDHYENPETLWAKKYGKYDIVEKPHWESRYSIREYVGKIKFKNIEEYAQFLADEYGWTSPDARIYYANGNVTEIFGKKR